MLNLYYLLLRLQSDEEVTLARGSGRGKAYSVSVKRVYRTSSEEVPAEVQKYLEKSGLLRYVKRLYPTLLTVVFSAGERKLTCEVRCTYLRVAREGRIRAEEAGIRGFYMGVGRHYDPAWGSDAVYSIPFIDRETKSAVQDFLEGAGVKIGAEEPWLRQKTFGARWPKSERRSLKIAPLLGYS